MKNYKIEKLSEKHNDLIDAFFCVETKEMLIEYNSKQRRKIIRHSQEMDTFIKTVALKEQKNGLNTTHMLIDNEKQYLVGFISLCNDSIILNPDDVAVMKLNYITLPAVKIARLAINREYRNMALGKFLIGYSTVLIANIKEFSGVALVTLDCYEDKIDYYQNIGFKLGSNQYSELDYDNLYSMYITLNDLAKTLVEMEDLI